MGLLLMQLAHMEREISKRRTPAGSIAAARCYYRAAAEVVEQKLDEIAAPAGFLDANSQHFYQLVEAVITFIRVLSSWAQMEFEAK